MNPDQSYSSNVVELEFCELRLLGILRSSPIMSSGKPTRYGVVYGRLNKTVVRSRLSCQPWGGSMSIAPPCTPEILTWLNSSVPNVCVGIWKGSPSMNVNVANTRAGPDCCRLNPTKTRTNSAGCTAVVGSSNVWQIPSVTSKLPNPSKPGVDPTGPAPSCCGRKNRNPLYWGFLCVSLISLNRTACVS